MMTLGNLYYKFGAKGNPILLSPEYRLELNNIKGLFVSIIVLITVLTLRLFLSPDQMSYGMFEWVKVIPDEVSKYGHLIMSIIAFGLIIAVFNIIKHEKQKIDNHEVPEFPRGFKYHFTNLFYVLMAIVLLYFVPFVIGGSGSRFFTSIPKNGIYEWFANISKSSIPAFDVFILIVSLFTLGVSLKLRNIETTNKDTYGQLSNIGIVFSVFLFFWTAFCEFGRTRYTDTSIFQFDAQNIGITVVSFILLFTLSGVSADPKNTSGLHNKVFELLDLTNTSESYVLSKVLVALLMLFPLGSFIMMIKSYFTVCSDITQILDIMRCIFTSMSSSFTLSILEVFNIIKGILLLLAFVFSGLTIKEYTQHIAATDKYNMYHNKFRFDITFIFAMIFLMVVLVTSFLNTDNFPLLLAMSVEYLAPIIILVMASYLVYYANDLAKLSKEEVLNDVQKEKKQQRELPDLGDKNAPVATGKTYDGTTHKI
jgi:hypothetical protein